MRVTMRKAAESKLTGFKDITAVICTNESTGGDVVYKESAYKGTDLFPKDNPDFVIDFSTRVIAGYWGGRRQMTKSEAARFGADFGLWFCS